MSRDGTLGTETHRVEYGPRGGTSPGLELPVIKGTGGRILDDTSAASVVIPGTAECCRVADQVDPGAHELLIYRGDDEDPWWVGPICTIIQDVDKNAITINAKDLTKWFDLRVLHETLSWTDEDLATIVAEIVDDGLYGGPVPDNPGIDIQISPTGVIATAEVLAAVRQTTGQLIRMFSDRGLDWTMIGRVFKGFRHQVEANAPTLTSASFVKAPRVRRTIDTYQSFAYVIGSGGASGVGGAFDPYYGLIERLTADPSVTSNFDAEQLAGDVAAALSETGSFIDPNATSTLSPGAELDFEDLCPGRVFPVELDGCPDVEEDQRLRSMRVQWDATKEVIQIGTEPVAGTESAILPDVVML